MLRLRLRLAASRGSFAVVAAARTEVRTRMGEGRRLLSSSSAAGASTDGVQTPITWPRLLVLLGAGGFAVGYYLREKEKAKERVVQKNTKVVGKALLGGAWTLVDHTGRAVTDATLLRDGRFGLMYFGFTRCPDICPSELVKMTKVIHELDKDEEFRERVTPLFVSVDPRRDCVEQVAHYIKDFHPRTVGLTGTPTQIAEACKAFRVFFHSNASPLAPGTDAVDPQDEEYLIDHSIVMYLVGPHGEFVDFYTQMADADEVVARIKKQMREYSYVGAGAEAEASS